MPLKNGDDIVSVGYSPMIYRSVGYSLSLMLGELLRKARQDAGMTQEQLALRARVDRSYLSEIERNVRHPTVQMLLKLCRTMNLSAADIVSQLEKPPAKKPR